MKLRTQKITALMAAAVLGISALGSVPVTAAESTETADIGEAMAVDGEAVSSDLVAGTFKPSDAFLFHFFIELLKFRNLFYTW